MLPMQSGEGVPFVTTIRISGSAADTARGPKAIGSNTAVSVIKNLVFIGVFILSCDVEGQNPSNEMKNLCRRARLPPIKASCIEPPKPRREVAQIGKLRHAEPDGLCQWQLNSTQHPSGSQANANAAETVWPSSLCHFTPRYPAPATLIAEGACRPGAAI